MVMNLALILPFVIVWISSADHTMLRHRTVSTVSATLGQDVQLRCSKILVKTDKEVSTYPSWSDCYDRCHHVWSKDGNLIDVKSKKYKNDSMTTFGYCANFEGTRDMITTIPSVEEIIDNEDIGVEKHPMKCLTSILTIKDVAATDLGTYSCDLFHRESSRYMSYNLDVGEMQNITLIDEADSSVVVPQKVDYLDSDAIKYQGRNLMLGQCVVSGMDLQWNIASYSCTAHSSRCISYSGPLENVQDEDFWRCFNFTTAEHSPSKGVTESVVFFSNLCITDYVRLYCTKKFPSDDYVVATAYDGADSWHRYDVEECTGVTLGFVLSLTSILLIAAAIVAGVRAGGKCCSCCASGYSPVPMVLQYRQPLMQS